MKHCKKIFVATLLSAATFSAHAIETTIDFENQTTNSGLLGEVESLTIENVTFTASDVLGGPSTFFFSDFGSDPDFSGKYLVNGATGFSTLTFSFADVVSKFSFNFGDNQHDWELTAFNSSNVSIGNLLIDRIPALDTNNGLSFGISSMNNDISYATLVLGAGPAVPFPALDQVEIDNFKYTTAAVSPVPEPSTYALMLGGLGLVGFMAYRRRKATNA